MQFGTALVGVPSVQDILRLKYPDLEIDSRLLSRLLKKEYDLHLVTIQSAWSNSLILENIYVKKAGCFMLI